jgi:hypothetical protein
LTTDFDEETEEQQTLSTSNFLAKQLRAAASADTIKDLLYQSAQVSTMEVESVGKEGLQVQIHPVRTVYSFK